MRQAEEYESVFTEVRSLVNSFDPAGLIRMGMPPDEYDPEVRELTRLALGRTVITAQGIDDIWAKWFGSSFELSADALEDMAMRLEGLRTRGPSGSCGATGCGPGMGRQVCTRPHRAR